MDFKIRIKPGITCYFCFDDAEWKNMLIPIWKKWISYLLPWPVERRTSEFNPDLRVVIARGKHQLLCGDAIYSFDVHYDNFANIFERINWERIELQQGLLLGLGLASIPVILEEKHHLMARYTAVDIDPVVIDLAKKYALPYLQSPVEVHLGDAAEFIKTCEQKFDFIFIDLFVELDVPMKFMHHDFLGRLANMLRPGGVILQNCVGFDEQEEKHTTIYFEQLFKKHFTHAKLIPIAGNMMLLSDGRILK